MELATHKKLDRNGLVHPLSFEAYLDFHQNICAGNYGSHSIYEREKTMQHTKVNLSILQNVLETISLEKKLYNSFSKIGKQDWIYITEPWCGAGSFVMPLFHAISMAQSNINFTIYLRDENELLMQQALTNGSKTIPKLLILNEEDEILGTWGPRPKAALALASKLKSENKISSEINEGLIEWYLNDKTMTTQEEILQLIKSIT